MVYYEISFMRREGSLFGSQTVAIIPAFMLGILARLSLSGRILACSLCNEQLAWVSCQLHDGWVPRSGGSVNDFLALAHSRDDKPHTLARRPMTPPPSLARRI